jgi:hypothetical protein
MQSGGKPYRYFPKRNNGKDIGTSITQANAKAHHFK